jgi:hypothetical protein
MNPFSIVQQPAHTPAVGNPTELVFVENDRQRPVELLPPRLIQHDDDFGVNANFYAQYHLTPGVVGVTIDDGLCTFSGVGVHDRYLAVSRPLTAPHFAAEVAVHTKGAGATYNDLVVGLMWKESDYLVALWSLNSNALRIDSRVAGVKTQIGGIVLPEPAGPFKFGFALTRNYARVYYDAGDGWILAITAQLPSSAPDFRDPAVFQLFRGAFGASSGGSTVWKFNNFRCGSWGQDGLRDNAIVKQQDGAPLVVDNRLYFTATASGTGEGSHAGIFRMDLQSQRIERTGSMFVKRNGLVYNDLPASAVWDSDASLWRVLVSTWGNAAESGELHVLHAEHSGNLLHQVTVFDSPPTLALTADVNHHVYDADTIFDAASGRWYVAYIATNSLVGGVPWLNIDWTTDFVTFTNVLNESAVTPYEGARLMFFGGTLYAFTGGLNDFRVYDAKAGVFLGTLNVAHPGPGTVTPHPMIYPVMRAARTEWWLALFDATLTATWSSRGTLRLHRAVQSDLGFAFPVFGA